MVMLKDAELGSLKVLLIGASGSGKTCLATTLGERALVLDLNNGLASAKLLKDRWTEQRGKCEVLQCWGPGGPSAMWQRTVGYINTFATKPSRPALVIDGLSDLAEASLGHVLQSAGKWDLGATTLKGATQPEWGIAIAQVERLLWTLRSIEALVLLVGHTKLAERDGQMREVLGVYGQNLGGAITKAFDEVWYQKVEGAGSARKYVVQTLSSAGVECKTRRQLPERSDVSVGMDGLLEMIQWKWPNAGAVK